MADGSAAALSAGSGSLWNPNSWHWESRNYNKWGLEVITAKLRSFRATVGDVSLRVTNVVEPKVEATVNIRKGKKIAVFDISFRANYEGMEGSSPALTTGELIVTDLMPDDVEDDFDVRITCDGSSAQDGRVKEAMRSKGVPALRATLRTFLHELLEHDGGLEKLALDAKRREEEKARADAARADKGEEKERIAAEAKAREAARALEAKRADEEKRAAGLAAPAAVAASGTGSVWNAGSYHWEEKPLTPWARDRLAELMKGYNLDIPGGHIKVVEVTLTGEASASIRKGKKLVFFDFKIKAKWEGEMVDGDGNVLGTGDGEIDIPELDQDNVDDFSMRITAAEDGGASDKQLKALFEKHGAAPVRAKIVQFVTELKGRG